MNTTLKRFDEYSEGSAYFITCATDGLLEGNKSSVICCNDGGLNCMKIEDVVFKKYQINQGLLELGMKYGAKL